MVFVFSKIFSKNGSVANASSIFGMLRNLIERIYGANVYWQSAQFDDRFDVL